jgi:hypothetical protein
MKTPEQMADAFIDLCNDDDRVIAKASFLAGYQAAKDQLADADKVTTADYVETAINDAKQLICTYKLEGDKDILIKALVAAYCSGVDAVDGYLRNSLSAYRNSVKRLQWISVKDRLPEDGDDLSIMLVWRNIEHDYDTVRWRYQQGWDCVIQDKSTITHWMPLPKPPKEEK